MTKTILITGATDGIGREAAMRLAADGHTLLLHGRDEAKLADLRERLRSRPGGAALSTYVADLSRLADVAALAEAVLLEHDHLDVLINNAGVFKVADATTPKGHDVRFVVNTVAPYLLTRRLLPVLGAGSRIVNLSSAAQAPVDLQALERGGALAAMEAYAQSKLAITMWSRHLADELGDAGPVVVAVNPGSLLATRMVKEGFGVEGNDIGIGADVLVRAASSGEFADATGRYFDNDARRFADPHPDALDPALNRALGEVLDRMIDEVG